MHVHNVYIRTQDVMDIKYNRIINLIVQWYKCVSYSAPILQAVEHVHMLLMICFMQIFFYCVVIVLIFHAA
jgi:succinate dehydrogenase/fumarate reductase cytochrome b subunit